MAANDRELTLRFLAQPKDVNYGGKAFGGAVMGWIDQAAYALAAGWSGHYAVTVYVGGIQFEAPVPIGSLVEVRARLLYTCLLYTSPSPRDRTRSRMPSSA